MTRQRVLLLFLAWGLGALAPEAMAQHREAGMVVSNAWEDGTVLLETDDSFRLVVVDPATGSRSAGGRVLRLQEIRPGDLVEYVLESHAGMWLTTGLRVVPLAHALDSR